jgi:hypothetical protein
MGFFSKEIFWFPMLRKKYSDFVGGQNFFSDNTRDRIFFFFCREFFFPEFNIRLYDKNSESGYFFSSNKIRIFFPQHWESEYFFRKKTHSPSLEVKWSLPYSYNP